MKRLQLIRYPWGVMVEGAIPARLWNRILAAHENDEPLARCALATAFLVAADHVASPPVPARRIGPVPYLGPEYMAKEPGEWPPRPVDLDQPGYIVEEGVPHDMPLPAFPEYLDDDPWDSPNPPVLDPWAKSWD